MTRGGADTHRADGVYERRFRPQPLLATAALFSGAALLASIYLGAPLAIALALLGLCAGLALGLRWAHTPIEQRPLLLAQLRAGVAAGLAATAAYDIARLVLVELGQLGIRPFETFNIFGQLILGLGLPRWLTFPAGMIYHLLNGVMFATAYCLLLGGRNWLWGVVWAFGLEAAMLAVYPGWLDLEAVMREFVAVSVVGHVAYGATLGVLSRHMLGTQRSTGRRRT